MTKSSLENRVKNRHKKRYGKSQLQLKILRWFIAKLYAISPKLGLYFIERFAMRPIRHKRPKWEEKNLETATPFTFKHNGKDIAVWRWGRDDAKKPPVLLLHGWSGRGSQISEFAEMLLAAGFQPYSMDAPSHGDSACGYISMGDYALAVRDLQTAIGRDVHGIIAHSMAGPVALAASKIGVKASHIVTIGSPIGQQGFLNHARKSLGLDDAMIKNLKRHCGRRTGIDWDDINTPELGNKLPHIKGLIIHDKNDKAVSFETAENIHDKWENSRLIATESLGHRRILRNMDVISAAIEFMQS